MMIHHHNDSWVQKLSVLRMTTLDGVVSQDGHLWRSCIMTIHKTWIALNNSSITFCDCESAQLTTCIPSNSNVITQAFDVTVSLLDVQVVEIIKSGNTVFPSHITQNTKRNHHKKHSKEWNEFTDTVHLSTICYERIMDEWEMGQKLQGAVRDGIHHQLPSYR